MPAAVRAGGRPGAGAALAPGAIRLYGRRMGFWELLVLLFIVLLFFGAGKLPALGDGLGKAVRGFREAARAKNPPGPPGGEAKPGAAEGKTGQDPS